MKVGDIYARKKNNAKEEVIQAVADFHLLGKITDWKAYGCWYIKTENGKFLIETFTSHNNMMDKEIGEIRVKILPSNFNKNQLSRISFEDFEGDML